MTWLGRGTVSIGLVVALAGDAAAQQGRQAAQTDSAQAAAPAAAARPETDEPGVRVSRNKGRTILEAPGTRIELTNSLQFRWTGDWLEGDDRTATGSFRVRRARTRLTGRVYGERVGFGVQLDWATDHVLEDAFVELDATGGGALELRMGRYKVPFGRQRLTSSGLQQFVDRSITSLQFGGGRDVGVMLHGRAAGGRVSWGAGIFNGDGSLDPGSDAGRYRYDARVQLAPNGDPGYSESDLESGDRPLYAIAVQFEHDRTGPVGARSGIDRWGGDAAFKFRGFSLLAEAFFARAEAAPAGSARSDGLAFQAGYLLPGRRLELAGRYARWAPEGGDERTETGGAVSWYHDAHRLKLQADLRFLGGVRPDQDDTELRVQAQLVF